MEARSGAALLWACAALLSCRSTLGHSQYRSMIPNGLNIPGTAALGHLQLGGGGQRNVFGKDFAAAGYRWTRELCEKDSDGDGESNGMELGDPCCEWKEGDDDTFLRLWRTSHPGVHIGQSCGPGSNIADVVCSSGLPFPNCTELRAQHVRGATVSSEALVDAGAGADSDRFWAFYFSDGAGSLNGADPAKEVARRAEDEAEKRRKAVLLRLGTSGGAMLTHGGQDLATVAIVLSLAAYVWLCKWESSEVQVAPRRPDGGRGGSGGEGLLREALLLLLAAVVFTDLASGLLHVVLDNPLFNTWPVVGPAAVGFQHHHHDPGGVTRGPLWKFLREHHVGVLLAMLPGLVPSAATGARPRSTRRLRIFLTLFAVLSSFMMWSHRWSHARPTELNGVVAFLQRNGLLMSQRHHSLHHVGYDMNFAIFTGWTNPLLNVVVARVVSARSEVWIYVLAGLTMLPGAVTHRAVVGKVLRAGRRHTTSKRK